MNGWEALGNAVVRQAVEDWNTAAQKLSKPHSQQVETMYRRTKNECEQFFLSRYFNRFTDVNGRELLNRLNERLEKEINYGE